MADRVSGSRLRRFGKLAWLGRNASRLMRRGDDEQNLASKTAEELFGTLGELKGLALKLGQMLSYMDGLLPPDADPGYRKVLAKLQDRAPSLPWETVREVFIEDLGELERHFEHIETEPFAAASIGQVHRARLKGGQQVAVKIQYPGIAGAINADLKNLNSMKSAAGPLLTLMGGGQGLGLAKEALEEIRERLLEELDYENEARHQATFGEIFADAPGIVVPHVHPEHSSRRVLVTSLEAGLPLESVVETADRELRDLWGHRLVEAVTHQVYRHGLFNADPHPGNYLFRADGTVVLLDFGCVKRLTPDMIHNMKAHLRTAIVATRTQAEADWRAFDQALTRSFNLEQGSPEVFQFLRGLLLVSVRPLLKDELFEYTPELVTSINRYTIDAKRELFFPNGSRLPRFPKMPPMPADYTLLNRLQWGFLSVLTRLRARVNWNALLPADMRG